ncbi:Cullin family profile domain-containing protein [Entamoeba marina]
MQNIPNFQNIRTSVKNCLNCNTSQFFTSFQQLCYQITTENIQDIKDMGKLYNELYYIFPLIKQRLQTYLEMFTIPLNNNIISSLQFLKTIPLPGIIDDYLDELVYLCFKHCLQYTSSLKEFNQYVECLLQFINDDTILHPHVMYMKKYIPNLSQFIASPSILPQFDDFQIILSNNKSLVDYFMRQLRITIQLNKPTTSQALLTFLLNISKNLCIIDGSLYLCKMCLDLLDNQFQNISIDDYLNCLQQKQIQFKCFENKQWGKATTPTFQKLNDNERGLYPFALFKLIAMQYGDTLLEMYEKRLAQQLLHCTISDLNEHIESYTFLKKNLFGKIHHVKSSTNTDVFKTIVITPAYWPELTPISFTDIPSILAWKQQNIKLYKQQHPQQHLHYTQNGTVKIRYTSINNITSIHVVTPLQATALKIIIECTNGVFLTELSQMLSIDTEVLTKALLYWVDSKVIIAEEHMNSVLLQKN